jgi:HD-like signal output (HDOD) protein
MNAENYALSNQAQVIAEILEPLINNNGIEVPMLPEVANKALLLAQNPDSDATEMAKLIQGDQSLAGHVMRIANSVAYTPLTNLVSLQQAISRLGMRVISEIALSASIGSKLFNTPGYESHVAKKWRHALATGLWSKEIARHCRSNVEVAFLAGLLHSIGGPAVLQAALDTAKQQDITLTLDDFLQLEKRFSQQLAEQIVTAWKMPVLVVESISYFADYNSAPTAVNQAALVNAGIEFATHMLSPEVVDKESLLVLPVMTTLNLYQDEIEKLLSQSDAISGRLEGLSA